MGNDSNSAPVMHGAAIGLPMVISFDGDGMVKGTLIGMEYGLYILVKLPPIVDIAANLYQKNHTIVRYFHAGKAYGFRTTLIGLIKEPPLRLCIFAHPDAIESLNLRKSERYDCLIPACVCVKADGEEKTELQGVISDVSLGGCSFEGTNTGDAISSDLKIGGFVDLLFRVADEETWRVVSGEVRVYKVDGSKLMIGLKFTPDVTEGSHLAAMHTIQTLIEEFERK